MDKFVKKYRKIFLNKTAVLAMSAVFIITVIVSANMVQTDEAVLASAEITNWGLSFQSEGQTPIGNATKEYLEQYDSYFVGDETEKKIYLTFDAGYENGYTENILDVLKKHDVSATFFLVGNYLETQADLVQRMVDEGHTVGNHTWSHPDMASISTEESFVEELEKVEEKFYEITGQEMLKLYRPPQGKFSEENLLIAQELGYSTVFWSLAYVDWYENEQPSQEEAFAKLIPRIHNGAIVLLHSTSQTNSEILDELLTKWEELGYEIASIEDLIV